MPRGKTFDHALAAIGDTPMIRINRIVPEEHATVFAKCEFFQPLNSVTRNYTRTSKSLRSGVSPECAISTR